MSEFYFNDSMSFDDDNNDTFGLANETNEVNETEFAFPEIPLADSFK